MTKFFVMAVTALWLHSATPVFASESRRAPMRVAARQGFIELLDLGSVELRRSPSTRPEG